MSIDDTAATCARWGVTVDQFNAVRPLVKQIRAQIRAESKLEAERLESWLFDHDLASLSRPDRRRATRDFHGARQWQREAAGYDFLEQLTGPELARVRLRMVDGDLHRPDLLAEHVRRKVGDDGWTDDRAIAWLVDRWLTADALRSVASGRVPKYGNPADLMPATLALDGYQLEQLLGVSDEDAACHVATVLAEAEQRHWRTALGVPIVGPAPWAMDANDYAAELEALSAFLGAWQIVPGVPVDPVHTAAVGRLAELVPPELDYSGCTSDYEVHDVIRCAALAAGLLEPAPVRVAVTVEAEALEAPGWTSQPAVCCPTAGVAAGPRFGTGAGRDTRTVAMELVPSWQQHRHQGRPLRPTSLVRLSPKGGPRDRGRVGGSLKVPHVPSGFRPYNTGASRRTSSLKEPCFRWWHGVYCIDTQPGAPPGPADASTGTAADWDGRARQARCINTQHRSVSTEVTPTRKVGAPPGALVDAGKI